MLETADCGHLCMRTAPCCRYYPRITEDLVQFAQDNVGKSPTQVNPLDVRHDDDDVDDDDVVVVVVVVVVAVVWMPIASYKPDPNKWEAGWFRRSRPIFVALSS